MATLEEPAYDTKGTEKPDLTLFFEKGSNAPNLIQREYVPALVTPQLARQQYARMLHGDAQVRTTVRACSVPVLGGEWFLEPGGQEQVDMDAAEFVDYNLFHGMTSTWTHTMEHILTMLPYGSAVLEPVYIKKPWRHAQPSRNTRNFIMLQKLAPRPINTIKRFLYDANGGPAGIIHVKYDPSNPAAQPKDEEIGIEKLVIFTYDKQGGNLEGVPILRTAYKHWYFKENLYKIDAVQKERHGIGVPKIKLPPGYTEDDLKFARELAENIRTNERAHILEPPGWEVTFVKPEGNMVDVLASAMHHDLMIARNVLVQFINMGSGEQSGARATSATMLDLFLKSLRHLGNLIADCFNAYLIPKLVDYNFEVDRYPQLKVRRIGDNRDLQLFAAALERLVNAKLITPDAKTEEWLRTEIDMIQNTSTYEDQPARGWPGENQAGAPATGQAGLAPTDGGPNA